MAAIVLALLALVLAPLLAPAPAEAATACRVIGGAAGAGGGGSHATVVVDTGSGPVWSACITFSGTISGKQALDLAAATIRDLTPEYELYGANGAAVCKLRGVGNERGDCLAATTTYWAYFRNGSYSPAGAGATRVSDGDIEGWRWGTGGAPGAATRGSEAARASAPTTSSPPPTTTGPAVTAPAGPGSPGGGTAGAGTGATSPSGSPTVPGGGPAPTSPDGSAAPTSPGAAAGATSTTGLLGAPTSSAGDSPDSRVGRRAREDRAAVRIPRTKAGSSSTSVDDDGGSSTASLVAFTLVLVVAAAGGFYLRRRRTGLDRHRHLPPPPA